MIGVFKGQLLPSNLPAGINAREETLLMMFKNLTIRELFLTLDDQRVADFFHEGLQTNNSIMALPAMSELYRRGDLDSIYENLRNAVVDENKIILGSPFAVALANALVLLGDRDKGLRNLGEELTKSCDSGNSVSLKELLTPKVDS